jgi:hypothetical protein
MLTCARFNHAVRIVARSGGFSPRSIQLNASSSKLLSTLSYSQPVRLRLASCSVVRHYATKPTIAPVVQYTNEELDELLPSPKHRFGQDEFIEIPSDSNPAKSYSVTRWVVLSSCVLF